MTSLTMPSFIAILTAERMAINSVVKEETILKLIERFPEWLYTPTPEDKSSIEPSVARI